MSKVFVGTKNPVKIEAVKVVLKDFEIIGKDVDSKVRSQPLSDYETIEGAKNRAESLPRGYLRFGLEAGVMQCKEVLYLVNWGVLIDEDDNYYYAGGSRIPLPNFIKDELFLEKKELSTIIDKHYKTKNIKYYGGAISLFTNSQVKRIDIFIHIVKLLYGQYLAKKGGSMKGLILLADGFEDTEAFTTIDILKRSGINLISATPNLGLNVRTQCGLNVKADILFSEVKASDYDFLVIPGGKAIVNVWDKNSEVLKLIKEFINNNKLIAAICAAPSLIAKIGGFKNQVFTCFPGFEQKSIAGKYKGNSNVIESNNFITAKSMFYTIDFALRIVEKLLGTSKSKEVLQKIKGIV